ncbi:MAG: transcriptional regulator, TetR family [Frankiales bacterium]|nr:transcriptional regulator, TetR family [Frankiales bacterium]
MGEGEATRVRSAAPEGRQAQRTDLSTRRLLDAAAELISERGYARTTLAEIGRRAGYSHGLVTMRFGTKAGLLEALIDRMARRFGRDQMLTTAAGRTGVDALTFIILEVRQEIERNPGALRSFYSLLFEAVNPASDIHSHLSELNDEYLSSVCLLVQAGVDAGTVRTDIAPDVIAGQFSATLRGISYFWLSDVGSYDVLGQLAQYAEDLKLLYGPR